MKIAPFQSLREHIPSFHAEKTERAPSPVDPYDIEDVASTLDQARYFEALHHNELLFPSDRANPLIPLAESIDKFAHDGEISPTRREALKLVILHDAENLAAHILPKPVVNAFHLQTTDDKEIGYSQTDSDTDIPPPVLPEVMLLASAYDVTHDQRIADILNYILNYSAPPAFSDNLALAYSQAMKTNANIIDTYQGLAAAQDTRMDRPSSPAEARFPLDVRRATSSKYRAEFPEEDVEKTGIN